MFVFWDSLLVSCKLKGVACVGRSSRRWGPLQLNYQLIIGSAASFKC